MEKQGAPNYIFYVLIIFLQGCATTSIPDSPQYNPINVSKFDLPSVGVGNIESLMTPGKKLGGYHAGLLRINWQPYVAQGVVSDEANRHYQKMMFDELKQAGYSLAGQETLFGESDSAKERFLFGGQILDGRTDSYDILAGHKSISTYKVNWQVYDKVSKSVIYQNTATGSGKAEGLDMGSATNLAFRNSFRSFLSDEKLVSILGNVSRENPD